MDSLWTHYVRDVLPQLEDISGQVTVDVIDEVLHADRGKNFECVICDEKFHTKKCLKDHVVKEHIEIRKNRIYKKEKT